MELEDMIEDVKNILSEARFMHSVGVMRRCEELAKIYGVDVEIAKKVGITHDIAKELGKEKSLQYVKENGIEVEEIERLNTALLHGKIGADIVKKKYGFSIQMQKAIMYHTTGNPEMDMLAKILFAADKTEEYRKGELYDVAYERELADKNINQALIYMIEENIKINIERNKLIEPSSIVTRNLLITEENKEE